MRLIATVAGAALLLSGCANSPKNGSSSSALDAYPGDLAVAWNQRVLDIAGAEDHYLTLKGVRTASMMHLAMHDALNAINPQFAAFAYKGEAKDADPFAAAAQAAYEVAVAQYPDQKAQLEEELNGWLGKVADGAGKTSGIALGQAAAAAVVKQRDGDGWDTQAEYKFHPMGPGVYAEFQEHSGTPQGFVFGTGWAKAKPFLLTKADQFRVPPPPAIDSDEYTKAYDEVKDVGANQSKTRTADQAHAAIWWKDFCDHSMNKLSRELVTAEKLNLWAASRMFALVNATIYDGYVSVFENKFHYNHWRPFTAIRWAENDGNPKTAPDLEWNNLHKHTYAFPSYPSAHGTVCAATLSIMGRTFGDDYAFTMTTPEVNEGGPMSPMKPVDPPTRSFKSFSSAAMECAMSRLYLGIHFRYDSVEGNKLGNEIGAYAWDNYLKPL